MLPLVDASAASLHSFVPGFVEPGPTVITDGWQVIAGWVNSATATTGAVSGPSGPAGRTPASSCPAGCTGSLRWPRGGCLVPPGLGGRHTPGQLPERVRVSLQPPSFRQPRDGALRVIELAVAHDLVRYKDLVATQGPPAVLPAPPQVSGHPPRLDRPPANRPWRTSDEVEIPATTNDRRPGSSTWAPRSGCCDTGSSSGEYRCADGAWRWSWQDRSNRPI